MPIKISQSSEFQRIAAIGTSCVGKTTFARKLAACLGIYHLELDTLFWQPGWVERPATEFRLLVEQATSAERWVADGNYSSVRDIVWRRATDIIWLDYSFPIIIFRALSRTVHRILTREELFSGNKESFRQSFFSRNSIIFWILKTFRRNRVKYASLKKSEEWRHIKFWEFKHPSEASTFLSQCGSTAQQLAGADQSSLDKLRHGTAGRNCGAYRKL